MTNTEPASRPTLLLLSGLMCDRTAWEDVAARLPADWDVRLVSFPHRHAISEMAEQALAEGPGPFAVAGHSMGGRVALEMVARAPERVERIALLNTGVHPAVEAEREPRGKLVALARSEGMAAVADAWLPPMLSTAGKADAGLVARLRAMVEAQHPESFAAQIEALLNRPDARPVLSTLTIPTLLLSGTEDGWSPVAQHAAMLDEVPHATLVALEGAGHFAPSEQPGAVAAAIRKWMVG